MSGKKIETWRQLACPQIIAGCMYYLKKNPQYKYLRPRCLQFADSFDRIVEKAFQIYTVRTTEDVYHKKILYRNLEVVQLPAELLLLV